MEIVLEKSQVVDLRLDLHKQGISIGDDLDLVVTDQDQFILYFEPKRFVLQWRCISYMEIAPLAPPFYFGIRPNLL